MRFGSVCSGVEAASLAWHPLGWEAAAFSEIDPHACSVLAHRFPTVPNLGDMTRISDDDLQRIGHVDILVGGTPCQSFSVAGLRKGLADPRGNLALVYLGLADRVRPRWIVWENVPGVLSSNGGRDFGAFLGALGELGYGFAYRVLDAQYFGVPQRRRRVFVVGHLGDWRRAAAVLLERESVRRNPPPRREAGEEVAGTVADGAGRGCWWDGGQVSQTLDAVLHKGQTMPEKNRFPAVLVPVDAWQRVVFSADCDEEGDCPIHGIDYADCPCIGPTEDDVEYREVDGVLYGRRINVAHTLTGNGFDASEDGTGRGTPIVAFQQHGSSVGPMGTLRRGNGCVQSGVPFLQSGVGVRRITPVEAERLQGMPDDWTLCPHMGKPMSDSARYRMIGNSMAVPVMRWVGERIDLATPNHANGGGDER